MFLLSHLTFTTPWGVEGSSEGPWECWAPWESWSTLELPGPITTVKGPWEEGQAPQQGSFWIQALLQEDHFLSPGNLSLVGKKLLKKDQSTYLVQTWCRQHHGLQCSASQLRCWSHLGAWKPVFGPNPKFWPTWFGCSWWFWYTAAAEEHCSLG